MQIIDKPRFTVVGIMVKASWDELFVEMPKAWQTFFTRVEEIEYRVGQRCIDISLEESEGVYTQLVCAEVHRSVGAPQGMIQLDIPTQRYVYHRHKGPAKNIAASFGKIYDWAKENDLQADEFKIDLGYTAQGKESEHELFVRVGE